MDPPHGIKLDPNAMLPQGIVSIPQLRIEDKEEHTKFARVYLDAVHTEKIPVWLFPVVGRSRSIWYIQRADAAAIRQRLRDKWEADMVKEKAKEELQKKQSELEFKPMVKGSLYPSRPDIGQFSSDEKVEVLNYLANVRRGLDQVIDYLIGVTPQNPQNPQNPRHDSEKAGGPCNPLVSAGLIVTAESDGTRSAVFAAPPPAERHPSDSDHK